MAEEASASPTSAATSLPTSGPYSAIICLAFDGHSLASCTSAALSHSPAMPWDRWAIIASAISAR